MEKKHRYHKMLLIMLININIMLININIMLINYIEHCV